MSSTNPHPVLTMPNIKSFSDVHNIILRKSDDIHQDGERNFHLHDNCPVFPPALTRNESLDAHNKFLSSDNSKNIKESISSSNCSAMNQIISPIEGKRNEGFSDFQFKIASSSMNHARSKIFSHEVHPYQGSLQQDSTSLTPFHNQHWELLSSVKKKSTIPVERIMNQMIQERKRKSHRHGKKVKLSPPVKCNCVKTKCMKKYCECFSVGASCHSQCNCTNCKNKRTEKSTITIAKSTSSIIPSLGCSCSKSQCQKQYCECYKNYKLCTAQCRCINCINKNNHNGICFNNISLSILYGNYNGKNSHSRNKRTIISHPHKEYNTIPLSMENIHISVVQNQMVIEKSHEEKQKKWFEIISKNENAKEKLSESNPTSSSPFLIAKKKRKRQAC